MVIYEWKDWDNPCGVKGGMMSLLTHDWKSCVRYIRIKIHLFHSQIFVLFPPKFACRERTLGIE